MTKDKELEKSIRLFVEDAVGIPCSIRLNDKKRSDIEMLMSSVVLDGYDKTFGAYRFTCINDELIIAGGNFKMSMPPHLLLKC